MLEFKQAEIEDKAAIDSILQKARRRDSDYCFGNLFIWQKAFHMGFCINGGNLFIASGMQASPVFFMPVGENIEQGIRDLLEYTCVKGLPLRLLSVLPEEKVFLETAFPGCFSFVEDRYRSDYIYNSQDLMLLAGKKYHGKRNHISRFERLYTWQYHPITPGIMPLCLEMNQQWCLENGCAESKSLTKEKCAVHLSFDHFSQLRFTGGCITVDNKVVAYTFGEALTEDTFVIHVEKALEEYQGGYAMINREFANAACKAFRYINREEDMGREGLRKAKLSYRPAFLLDKYAALYLKK